MCDICQKKCKSKSGLKRHQIVHNNIDTDDTQKENRPKKSTVKKVLSKEKMESLMEEIRIVLIENKCYPDMVKKELQDKRLIVSDVFFEELSPIYNNFHKSGNTEKLYSSIFSDVILRAEKYFGLSRDVSTLLIKKLADRFTSLRKELISLENDHADDNIETESDTWIPDSYKPLLELSEIERHGLRYIGGYVYKKIQNSNDWKSNFNQIAISFLEAGRDNDSDDSFLDKINRGGLWKLSPPAEYLFLVVETVFRRNTSKKGMRVIDQDEILSQCYRNHRVRESCQTLAIETQMEIEPAVSKDIFFEILTLYIRVRAFSKAKKLLEQYKENTKTLAKEKALRKSIKQKSDNQVSKK